ncbi:MAG: sigma-70 family RNA polymerase sigma factor [Bacteroidetes bacterium]|nr:sigma-70 family RNA polymerase sigma factor [Bacteroidota bacterium]MBS1973216.1 sigma-70 family RNA polymerase sigma factor [Bacteroidota bacterium]
MSLSVTNLYLADKHQLIINGCLAGDRAAQAELYSTYCRKMMGVCMWYAKNREEAEEILQDGFVRVFKYLRTFKGEGSFEGWMRKTMVSAALSKYRNKSTHLRPVAEFNTDNYNIYEEPSFIYQYDEKELVKLIQTLSPAYRIVFNLYVFEGMKHREIAAALNISESTSKSNLADARKILQAALTKKKAIN